MKTEKKISVEMTRRGLPALWEEGGGYTNTGFATIVAGPEGGPLRPIYIRRRGSLANGKHALLPIRPYTVVVEADHHRGDFHILVWEVLCIKERVGSNAATALLGLVAEFADGEWDHEPLPEKYKAAVEAAKEKALCYHCREPHYFVAPE